MGVDLHFVKKNDIRGLVSTSLQFYYCKGLCLLVMLYVTALHICKVCKEFPLLGKREKGTIFLKGTVSPGRIQQGIFGSQQQENSKDHGSVL